MAANIRCIMRAKAPYGQGITKMKVKLTPSQSSTPSLMPETNSVYLSRPTEGTGELMELVGGSVAWNQLASVADATGTVGGVPYTISGDKVSLNGTATASNNLNLMNATLPIMANHVYYLCASGQTMPLSPNGIAFLQISSTNNLITISENSPRNFIVARASATEMATLRNRVQINTSYNTEYYPQIVDLTQMFGSTIADYVYSLEQSTAGSGIAWLKKYDLIDDQYHAYSAPTLQSVEATSHVTKDANNTTIATYPLDSDLVLRGIPKLSNGNLYYDGDTYEWDGTVTRKYGYRAYQSGDASDGSTMITDGSHTVYKLNTPTIESADPFTAVQSVEDGGTEEFVTTNGVPVGVVGRFANAVPMEGVDSFTVTANDGTSHTYPVTLSEEIYRGYVDMLTGEAVSDMASIAEYNGETINAPWLSSLDVYALGATPTKGAQVVYPIAPEEVTAAITGDPSTLSGVVSVTSTEGTVEWSELSEIGIKCIMKRKNPFQ